MFEITSKFSITKKTIEAANLTDHFTPEELERIGALCKEGYEADERSRSLWLERTETAMHLAMQIAQKKNFPWENASNVIFPLVSTAALQFSSRTYGAIILPDLVTYSNLIGEVTDQDAARNVRLSRHMTFQRLQQDTAWEEQQDRLYINIGVVGTAFMKSRYDHSKRCSVGELVLARDLVVNYWAKDLETAPRCTQRVEFSKNSLVTMVRQDAMRDFQEEEWFKNCVPQKAPPTSDTNEDERRGVQPPSQPDHASLYETCEQYVDLDLDCDGYAEPWIITFHRQTGYVLRMVLNVSREEDVERNRRGEIIRVYRVDYYTKYSLIPAPDGGFYDLGLGVLLGPLNSSVNTLINQLIDSGTLAITGGGLIGRGAKIPGGVIRRKLGEWLKVDSTGDDIRKAVYPLEHPEPSAVLFNLLGLLIEYSNLLVGSTDQVLGKNPGQNTPAETSRNMMETGLQVYTTIYKRLWRSMQKEFRKYHVLNRQFLPLTFKFGEGQYEISQEDYKSNPDWVRPMADPNTVSASQRVNQAIAVREAALTAPGGYNMEAVEKMYLRALRVGNIEEVFPGYEKFPPGENIKLQIEKLKLEAAQLDRDLDWKKFSQELHEAEKINAAKVAHIEAQALSILAELQASQSTTALTEFNELVRGLHELGGMLGESSKKALDKLLAQGLKQEAGNGSEGRRGGKSFGGTPGGASSPSARQMAQGDQGAVGTELPGGFTGGSTGARPS